MGKVGKSRIKDARSSLKKGNRSEEDFMEDDMDDEIDVFHKQRDIVPLEGNGEHDTSDEDNELPVFELETDSDEEDEEYDTGPMSSYEKKLLRTQKYLHTKNGGVEDDDGSEEKDEEDEYLKTNLHGADNIDSSDEENLEVELALVKKQQEDRAKELQHGDFGLEDSEDDKTSHKIASSEIEKRKTTGHKDLNLVSFEEEMDIAESKAPELIDLLAELGDAIDQFENKVNPVLQKMKERSDVTKEGIRYFEVKQQLLLLHCQAICFYLVLVSESEKHQVSNHPVLSRIEEIKDMLLKMEGLDENLPSDIEDLLEEDERQHDSGAKPIKESAPLIYSLKQQDLPFQSENSKKLVKHVNLSKDNKSKQENKKDRIEKLGLQSTEMLKVRNALEEKLKKGAKDRKKVDGLQKMLTKADGTQKHLSQPVNKMLQTLDDFSDEVVKDNGRAKSIRSSIAKLIDLKAAEPKINPGDEDVTRRDINRRDIGARRRNNEDQVLAKAGVGSTDEAAHQAGEDFEDDEYIDNEIAELEGSEDKVYRQAKSQRVAKQSAKEIFYPGKLSAVSHMAETEVLEGKRYISRQMVTNRGLTRPRNKDKKNPRKNNRMKHDKWVIRRKGQVRDVKVLSGPYSGEISGINAEISRSTRFKN